MNRDSLDTARLSHAYIVASPAEELRLEEARFLAAAMVCSAEGKRPCGACRDCRKAELGAHPDIIFVRRLTDDKGNLKKEIQVEQIRNITADAVVMPNEASCKVYVIPEANLMNSPAQNTILKVLEEPPVHTRFILCADSAESLLPTVRSRCVALSGNDDAAESETLLLEKAREYLSYFSAKDPAGRAAFCFANEGMTGADALAFAAAVRHVLAERLAGREPDHGLPRGEMTRLLEELRRAESYLSLNVSVKHVFGLLAVI